jgi:hypothetical protein
VYVQYHYNVGGSFVLTALEKTGKIVRTVGPVLGLGDTDHLISYGTIEPPMPLHGGYESVRLLALNMLEVQARVLETKRRVSTKTLFLYYGEEFMDFTPGMLRMTIPENHRPYARMPLSALTMDPHDVIVDHVVSLSGATVDVIGKGELLPCPEFGCLAIRLDVA